MACNSQHPPQTMPEMPARIRPSSSRTKIAELLVLADAGGRDGGRRHALLEQRQVGRIRRVLDDEAVRVVHRLARVQLL